MEEERPAGLNDALARAARLLDAPSDGGAAGAAEAAAGDLGGPPGEMDRRAVAAKLRCVWTEAPGALVGRDPDQEVQALATDIVARAARLVEELRHGAASSTQRDADVAAFEAILHVRGRPALRLEPRLESIEDHQHPGSGFWRPFVNRHEFAMLDAADATGAVMSGEGTGQQLRVHGTAWLVAPNLAVTNRHVLFPPPGGRVLASRLAQASTQARLLAHLDVVVDFAYDNRRPKLSQVYRVAEVPYVSPEADPVDVALLRLVRIDGGVAPQPLHVDASDVDPSYLYVIGHPGPVALVPESIQAVFGSPDGRKRVSLGVPMRSPERPAGELWHDASTIGGFSGGCVLAFGGARVAALHYRGHPLAGNRAFTAATLRGHAVSQWFGS